MAEHKVQLPDNSVITIEGPEDATDQELIDAASQHYANKQVQNSGPISAIAQTVDNAKNMGGLAYGAGAAGLAGLGALGLGKSLKDKFFSAEKPIERIEPQMDVNQQKPSEPYLEPETQTVRPTDWESSLSAEDRQLLERSRANAAVKASQPAPTAIPAGDNVVPQAQIPAAAQPAPVVPPAPVVEAPVNSKLPALLQPPAGAAPPPVVAPAIAEPVATPAAEPVATTTETPATKATNDQILETLNKVAPKPEVTPETTPAEEKLKWPGKETPGAERWTLGQIGASRENYTKKHAAAIELLKDRTNGILTATHDGGGGLVEQQKLSDLVEHYTGKPIPSKEGGGFARIPKEQVAELHAGILNELQEAAKGGKLKSLGKGALAAAALLGISEAVQAAQKGNFGPLKEAGFDIGIGALGGPAVMAGQMAMTGQTLASGMTPKGQKEYQNRQEILSRPGVQEQLKYLNVLNPNLSKADFNKRVDAYLATNPNAPKTKLQQFNEQTRQQQIDQTQKEHSLRK